MNWKGKNISFEELTCSKQELSFEVLHNKLKDSIKIETFNQDTLKTLNLYDNHKGYNNAAGLLADKNHFPGIDMVKFGENISVMQKRATFENVSVLEIYEKFRIDCNGWQIDGNWMEWDYTIQNGSGMPVAVVTKEVFNWTDTYVIDIVNAEDALGVLMVVLAIDAEKCSRSN